MISFIVGFLIGAIIVYLFAKNSPQHFIKSSNKLSSVVDKVKQKINKA